MAIEFESPKPIVQMQAVLKTVAQEMMRSKSRYFDEHELEIPWDYIEFMHIAMKTVGGGDLAPKEPALPLGEWTRVSEANARRLAINCWLLKLKYWLGVMWGCISIRPAANSARQQCRQQVHPNNARNFWRALAARSQPSPRCA